MKPKIIIPFLLLALILIFNPACSSSSTAKKNVETDQTLPQEETLRELYFEEMGSISKGITNASDDYYSACDDFLNLKIDLSEHKEATSTFVRRISVLYDDFKELEPPGGMEKVHDLYGRAMEHFNTCAGCLTDYIESENLDKMNDYLIRAVNQMEFAARYLNEANEELKTVHQD